MLRGPGLLWPLFNSICFGGARYFTPFSCRVQRVSQMDRASSYGGFVVYGQPEYMRNKQAIRPVRPLIARLPPQASHWNALSPALLGGLSGEQRLSFYAQCTPMRYAHPTQILTQEETTATAYLIVEGSAEIIYVDEMGYTVVAAMAAPGEVVGDVELLSGRPCAATCRVQANTKVLCFSANLLLKHVPAAELLVNFACSLHDKMVLNVRNHAIAQFYSAEDRIALHLNKITNHDDQTVTLSQDRLAALSGCSRQTVNRALAELRDRGVISLGRGMIHVHDRAALLPKLDD